MTFKKSESEKKLGSASQMETSYADPYGTQQKPNFSAIYEEPSEQQPISTLSIQTPMLKK